MSTGSMIARENHSSRYEAVLHISAALTKCCDPEELAKTLASEIEKFLQFDYFYLAVLKEHSKEVVREILRPR
jgi:hypothetical protein